MEELLKCKNVKLLGMWTDPKGVYGKIPIFEINEPSAEEWNAKARRQFRERYEKEHGEQECFPEEPYRQWQENERWRVRELAAPRKAAVTL